MKRKLEIVLTCCLLSAQMVAQQQIEVHIRPSLGQPLSTQQEEAFLEAATFGSRYYETGDLSSALEQLETADKIVPGHPAILYNTAVVLAKLGRYADAQNRIDTYKALYPDGAELAQVRALHIDLQWIRDAQRKAQENQNYIELFNRAKFSYDSGDFEESLELFRKAQQAKPEDAPAAFNQAISLEALGDYTGAIERLRQYLSLNSSAGDRSAVDEKIFMLNAEVSDMRTSILCTFCGRKLSSSGTWCPGCGHGPFVPHSAQWNTRSCLTGATATRSTFYPSGRLFQNEDLACLYSGSYVEALRYSTPKRMAIQAARKGEGWSYEGDVIKSFSDRDSSIELAHDKGQISHITSPAGDSLAISGTQLSDGRWQVQSEERVIDGQPYRKLYSYDEQGRVSQEIVRYQGANRCGNVIETTADWIYEGDRLASISLSGGYDGYPSEGAPTVSWKGKVTFTYDEKGHIQQEELTIESFEKTYAKFPPEIRKLVERQYPTARRGKPIDLLQKGDVCGAAGSQLIVNAIDLRAFDAWSPNLAIALPPGVTKATVSFTYPDSFSLQ